MGGCIDTSACYDVTTIGIEEAFGPKFFTISPNPTHGDVTIQCLKSEEYSFQVANALGTIVQKGILHQGLETKLSIEGPRGIYFITVFDQGSSHTEKIVKL